MHIPIASFVLFSSFVLNSTIYSYKPNYVRFCYNTVSFDSKLNETWPDNWSEMSNEKDVCKSVVNFDRTQNSMFAYKFNYIMYNGTNKTSEWNFGVTNKLNTQLFKEINSHETCNQSTFCSALPYLNVVVIVLLSLLALGMSISYIIQMCKNNSRLTSNGS